MDLDLQRSAAASFPSLRITATVKINGNVISDGTGDAGVHVTFGSDQQSREGHGAIAFARHVQRSPIAQIRRFQLHIG